MTGPEPIHFNHASSHSVQNLATIILGKIMVARFLRRLMGERQIFWIIWMILLAFALSTNATAAGSFTFNIEPEKPVVGQRAKYYLYAWVTAEDGEPDLTQPFNMAGYPFDVRAYQDEEFPGSYAPGDKGIPMQLQQIGENVWRGDVVFPEEGVWFIVVRNNYPPLTQTTPPRDQAILEVQVRGSGSYHPQNLVIAAIVASTLAGILIFVVWNRRRANWN